MVDRLKCPMPDTNNPVQQGYCIQEECAWWRPHYETENKISKVRPDGDGWRDLHNNYWRRYIKQETGDCAIVSIADNLQNLSDAT